MMRDYSYLAVDERGRAAFRAYLADLLALQTRLEAEPTAPHERGHGDEHGSGEAGSGVLCNRPCRQRNHDRREDHARRARQSRHSRARRARRR